MSVKLGRVVFKRIAGRIVPIKAGIDVGTTASAAITKKQSIKKNHGLQAASMASAVASGVISGATLFSGAKLFALGQTAGLGLDFASSGLNASANIGKGHKLKRVKEIARQEGINNIIGYGAMGATILAQRKGREKLIEYSGKVLGHLKNLAAKAAL